MRDVKCSYCEEYRNEWCEKVTDSPHPDILRDCQYFHEAKTRWIPCSERLPEEPFGCLVTVWDTDPVTMDEFENILPYFVGWDGEQWNDSDGEMCPFEVIAWIELPEPYKGGEQE